MQFRRLALLAVSAAITSGISTVHATTISNSLTGIASPAFVQGFENPSFTVNTLIGGNFSQVSSSTLFYDGNNAAGGCAFFQESGNCVSNFTTTPGVVSNIQPTFSIFFLAPQTSAAFALITGGSDNDTFTAFLNGVQVGTFSAVTASNYPVNGSGTAGGNFFGFANIGSFNQIQVQTTGSNLAVIDNIQGNAVSSIPEPGTIALFGLGIGGLLAFRRRQSA